MKNKQPTRPGIGLAVEGLLLLCSGLLELHNEIKALAKKEDEKEGIFFTENACQFTVPPAWEKIRKSVTILNANNQRSSRRGLGMIKGLAIIDLFTIV